MRYFYDQDDSKIKVFLFCYGRSTLIEHLLRRTLQLLIHCSTIPENQIIISNKAQALFAISHIHSYSCAAYPPQIILLLACLHYPALNDIRL